MAYLGTKPANQVIDSALIADGTITPADLSTGKPVWDTSGNVGIGTSSPSYKLDVAGSVAIKSNDAFYRGTSVAGSSIRLLGLAADDNVYVGSIDALTGSNTIFRTNGSERMIIDSSGNLLLGVSTSDPNLGAKQFYANGLISSISSIVPQMMSGRVAFGGGTGSPVAGRVLFGDNTGWQWEWGYVNASNVYGRRFYFTDGGQGYNSTGTWGTISDARLKENIVDASPKLEEIMKLKVRNFNFITEPEVKQIGFVAQEMEEVFPRLVDTSKPDEDGTQTKAVKTTVLIPILVKAIQEQQAIITQLQADVAELKGTA